MHISIKVYLSCILITSVFFATDAKVLGQTTVRNMLFDSTKAIKEITKKNAVYIQALSKFDSVALGNLYTPDARILNNGIPSTIGKAEIVKFYGEMIRNGVTNFSYATVGMWGTDNNLIVEEGTASFALANATIIAKGRYLLVWKREDGALKIFRDSFLSNGKIKN